MSLITSKCQIQLIKSCIAEIFVNLCFLVCKVMPSLKWISFFILFKFRLPVLEFQKFGPLLIVHSHVKNVSFPTLLSFLDLSVTVTLFCPRGSAKCLIRSLKIIFIELIRIKMFRLSRTSV